jgi:predicted HTH transcriptional regulator
VIYSVLPITTEELEGILSKGETSIVEFKQQHAWDALLFAKDILAFSNTRNGGYIIVGVEDKSHARQGVTPEQQASYNIDIMKDQISKYADPFVNFSVEFPKDNHGLIYVAISIFQFEQIPVICKISDQRAGVFAGVIYHRNSNRRPESAAVSNSYDMRTIIQMSTFR